MPYFEDESNKDNKYVRNDRIQINK
nr:hypothetical protein [Staphylococcus aureus]